MIHLANENSPGRHRPATSRTRAGMKIGDCKSRYAEEVPRCLEAAHQRRLMTGNMVGQLGPSREMVVRYLTLQTWQFARLLRRCHLHPLIWARLDTHFGSRSGLAAAGFHPWRTMPSWPRRPS